MSDAALMPGDARALAARGDFLGAIEAVPATEDAGLLAALAAWRLAAFDQARHPPGPASWPPVLPDPFPGETGIPAIEAAALTPAVLGGAIAHHGCLRVNGLVDRDTAERLRDGIDRALAAQEAHHNGRPGTDPAWFTPLDVPSLAKARQFSAGCGACWTGDSPAMLVAVIEALRRSGVLATIEALLGERPALSVAKSSLRRVTPGALHDWHQDGAFLGRDVRPVNVWLALNECGRTAPGMDIVARRLPYIVQTQSHGACFGWSVGDGLVRMLEEGGAPVLTPEFGPGDALLFDHMMLHRTSMMAGLKGIRYAIESWFFAPTNYPYDQVPLYV